MVSVTSVLAPRLSRLIVDADLDMKGYGILNAVLKAGNKLGADLDAQGKQLINAVLSGAKLSSLLDAAGNKITNLLTDEADLTSGVNMAALLDAIYPSVFYNRYLCWASEQPPPVLISGYMTGPRRILNTKPDYGVLVRTNAVETVNTVFYYYDMRHSHDLDTQDTAELQVTGTTPTEVLKYDYGAVLSVKELYMILGVWAVSGTGTLTAEVSSDGATWTKIWEASNSTATDNIQRVVFRNLSFRYLRFTLTNSGTYTTKARVRKIVITV